MLKELLKLELRRAAEEEIARMTYEMGRLLSQATEWTVKLGVLTCVIYALGLLVWAVKGKKLPKDSYELAYMLIGLSAMAYVLRAISG